MKRNMKRWLGSLVMALIIGGVLLTGCPQPTEDSDPTYTVWTRRGNASDMPDFQDGYYYFWELTDEQYNTQINTPFYQYALKHDWTENELKSYYFGLNFSSEEVNNVVAKIISYKHIEVGAREGAYINWLLK